MTDDRRRTEVFRLVLLSNDGARSSVLKPAELEDLLEFVRPDIDDFQKMSAVVPQLAPDSVAVPVNHTVIAMPIEAVFDDGGGIRGNGCSGIHVAAIVNNDKLETLFRSEGGAWLHG